MKKSTTSILAGISLVFAVSFFFWIDSAGRNSRNVPLLNGEGRTAPLYRVDTQLQAYIVYKSLGLRGARIVHLNKYFNIAAYFPVKETVSSPFPIKTYDIRPSYEEGLDSHNWLFIAAQTGLVRTVTTVVPESIFSLRKDYFESRYEYTVSNSVIKGYSYDIPRSVVTLDSLEGSDEPVIMNIDAGLISTVLMKYPRIRALVLIDSIDEAEINEGMRGRLDMIESFWRSAS
jgi:hypothetical protein